MNNLLIGVDCVAIRKGDFVLFPSGRSWIVYNTQKPFDEGHSHIKNKLSALAAIDFVTREKIPRRYSINYLISLRRISNSIDYITKVDNLITVRSAKGKKARYYNR